MNLRWTFDDVNQRVITENDEHTVFYTDELECDDKIIQKVVDIRNSNIDKTFDLLGANGLIDSYLLWEENISQDDREIIVEDIYSFFEKTLK